MAKVVANGDIVATKKTNAQLHFFRNTEPRDMCDTAV